MSLFYQTVITLVEFVFNLLLSAVCFFVTFRVSFACLLSLIVNKIHYHHHHHHHHHLFYQNIITLVEFVFNLLLSAVCFFVTFRVSFACLFVADCQ